MGDFLGLARARWSVRSFPIILLCLSIFMTIPEIGFYIVPSAVEIAARLVERYACHLFQEKQCPTTDPEIAAVVGKAHQPLVRSLFEPYTAFVDIFNPLDKGDDRRRQRRRIN